MGYIAKRGTRAAPRYYIQFKEAGKYRMVAAKGCRTLEEAKERLAKVEARIADGLPAFPEARATATATAMGPALAEWREGLSNRNAAVDQARVSKRIEPTFAKMAIADVTLPVVMRWLDELASPRVGMSGEGRRQALNLLSRFFSWAIERGLATVNPVKMIPTGKRPTPARKVDALHLSEIDAGAQRESVRMFTTLAAALVRRTPAKMISIEKEEIVDRIERLVVEQRDDDGVDLTLVQKPDGDHSLS